jgi:hypothetical protein
MRGRPVARRSGSGPSHHGQSRVMAAARRRAPRAQPAPPHRPSAARTCSPATTPARAQPRTPPARRQPMPCDRARPVRLELAVVPARAHRPAAAPHPAARIVLQATRRHELADGRERIESQIVVPPKRPPRRLALRAPRTTRELLRDLVLRQEMALPQPPVARTRVRQHREPALRHRPPPPCRRARSPRHDRPSAQDESRAP